MAVVERPLIQAERLPVDIFQDGEEENCLQEFFGLWYRPYVQAMKDSVQWFRDLLSIKDMDGRDI